MKDKRKSPDESKTRDHERESRYAHDDASADLRRHLLGQLEQTHARFAELMLARLEDSDAEEIERYFGLLSSLVAKLEDREKALKDVLREMAAEYAAIILMELNR